MVGTAYGNTEQCHTSDCSDAAGELGMQVLLQAFPRLFGGSSEGSSILCIAAGGGLTA